MVMEKRHMGSIKEINNMENKLNILGICGRITPSPSANTICLINVFEELVRDGYQCHILASGIENSEHNHNGVHYHVIKLNDSKL